MLYRESCKKIDEFPYYNILYIPYFYIHTASLDKQGWQQFLKRSSTKYESKKNEHKQSQNNRIFDIEETKYLRNFNVDSIYIFSNFALLYCV